MNGYLPDVNVLIALIDPSHVHHERAHAWFESIVGTRWITVPLTENGVLRIVSHPGYSNSQPVSSVVVSLRSLCETRGHHFEPDAISLLGDGIGTMLTSSQVTDTYLIALSLDLGVRLATFDRKITMSAVRGGGEVVVFIP